MLEVEGAIRFCLTSHQLRKALVGKSCVQAQIKTPCMAANVEHSLPVRNEETPSGETEEEVRHGQLFGSKIAFIESNWWGEDDATLRFAVTRVSRIATRNEEKQEGKKKKKKKNNTIL